MSAKPLDPVIAEAIVRDWRIGKMSIRDLADKHGVSRGKVGELCKGIPKDASAIVDAGIQYRQALAGHDGRMADAIEKEVEEQTKNLEFYNSGQNFLARVGLAKVKGTLDPNTGKPTEDTTPQLLSAVSGVVNTSRQGVIGMNPSTVINNTNAQQVNSKITYEVVR